MELQIKNLTDVEEKALINNLGVEKSGTFSLGAFSDIGTERIKSLIGQEMARNPSIDVNQAFKNIVKRSMGGSGSGDPFSKVK